MMIPTIHLNGTSRETLLEQVCDAANAIRDAQRVLQEAAPNGRDYYPLGPDAIGMAIAEHDQRQLKLQSVLEELQATRQLA